MILAFADAIVYSAVVLFFFILLSFLLFKCVFFFFFSLSNVCRNDDRVGRMVAVHPPYGFLWYCGRNEKLPRRIPPLYLQRLGPTKKDACLSTPFSPLADVGSMYTASAVRASVAQPRVLRAEVFGNTRTILYRSVVTFLSRWCFAMKARGAICESEPEQIAHTRRLFSKATADVHGSVNR